MSEPWVQLSGDELARAIAAADAHSSLNSGRRDQWVYDGSSYTDNHRFAAAGEFAAAKAMGAEEPPRYNLRAFDFIASGWRIDVKSSKRGSPYLRLRLGHRRKIGNSDVLALMSPVEQSDFRNWLWLGWIWNTEFAKKAVPYQPTRTEKVLQLRSNQLLRPDHWRWISMCAHREGTTADGPPWPGCRGPYDERGGDE